jgi:hypothetical protein
MPMFPIAAKPKDFSDLRSKPGQFLSQITVIQTHAHNHQRLLISCRNGYFKRKNLSSVVSARKHASITKATSHTVRMNDIQHWGLATTPRVIHIPAIHRQNAHGSACFSQQAGSLDGIVEVHDWISETPQSGQILELARKIRIIWPRVRCPMAETRLAPNFQHGRCNRVYNIALHSFNEFSATFAPFKPFHSRWKICCTRRRIGIFGFQFLDEAFPCWGLASSKIYVNARTHPKRIAAGPQLQQHFLCITHMPPVLPIARTPASFVAAAPASPLRPAEWSGPWSCPGTTSSARLRASRAVRHDQLSYQPALARASSFYFEHKVPAAHVDASPRGRASAHRVAIPVQRILRSMVSTGLKFGVPWDGLGVHRARN